VTRAIFFACLVLVVVGLVFYIAIGVVAR